MRFLTSLALVTLSTLSFSSAAIISRQSIDTFFNPDVTPKETTDLFYLAMQKMMDNTATDYKSTKSWFALAAIHGDAIVYDETTFINKGTNPNRLPNYGYCSHGDELFPTWHRPYLLALENAIQYHAHAIIDSLGLNEQQTTDGHTIASSIRLPYWDWDKFTPGLSDTQRLDEKLQIPAIFNAGNVTITNWLPEPKVITNPLKSYTLPKEVYIPGGIGRGNTTIRSNRPSTFYVDSLRDDISYVLTMTKWADASNHYGNDPVGASIESIHDTIHGFVGGSMGSVPTAGFDPIFWFHHNNVDRITAIYQAVRQESTAWISPSGATTQQNSVASFLGTPIDATTGLQPFKWRGFDQITHPSIPTGRSGTDFVTSEDIRDVTKWGYTYPELEYIKKNNLQYNTTELTDYLATLFPVDDWKDPGSNGINRRLLATTTATKVPTSLNWRISFEKFPINYFNGPIQIRVFLNLPTATAATPITSPNLATSIGTFNMASDTTTTYKPRSIVGSITKTIRKLNLVSGTVTQPNVQFSNIQVVITGSGIQDWIATATPTQLAQLKKDIAADVFTPKIKEYNIYTNPKNGQKSRTVKRYIGVPVTLLVAADGVATSVVSGSVRTLEVDMSGDDTTVPTATTDATVTTTSSNNLPVIIGAAVGGLVLLTAMVAIVITCRRRAATKSTVQSIQMDYQHNPAVQQL